MGRHEQGHPVVRLQLLDVVPDRGPRLDVQPQRRLVEEEQPGVVDEPAGYLQPSPHPSGVGLDLPVGRVLEPHELEQLLSALLGHAPGDPIEVCAEADVLVSREVLVGGVLLRDDADGGPDVVGVGSDAVPAHLGRPRCGLQECGQHLDRGGLARPVRAEESEDLALSHFEAQAVDSLEPAVERLAEAVHPYDGRVTLHPGRLRALPASR